MPRDLVKDQSWVKPGYLVSTDLTKISLERVHKFLTSAYWSKDISLECVEKSIKNSLPFGLYCDRTETIELIGFARVVSDYSTFAYLCDVFIIEEWRGRGLSKWLLECVFSHPELQGLRRFCLGTKDAHGLYLPFGFTPVKQPQNWLEIKKDSPYTQIALGDPSR